MDVLTSRKVKEEPGTRRASNRLIGAGEYRENVGILEAQNRSIWSTARQHLCLGAAGNGMVVIVVSISTIFWHLT